MEIHVPPGSSKYLLAAIFVVALILFPGLSSAQEESGQADSLGLQVPQLADSLPEEGTQSQDTSWVLDRSLFSLPFGAPLKRELFPGTVKLILREDIVRTGAQTLGELLIWVDGALCLDGGFLLDEQYLSMGGSLPHEVVFLIDGIRANEPSSGVMDLRDIPVESVYRVEILQGPMAGVIAGEATEAVVNVVTSRHPGGVPVSRISILDGDGGLLMVHGSLSREIPGNGYLHLTAARTSLQGLIGDTPSRNQQLFSRLGLDVRGVDVEGWIRRTSLEKEDAGGTTLGSHQQLTYGLTGRRRIVERVILTGTFSRTLHEFIDEFDFPAGADSETGRTGFDLSVLWRNGENRFLKAGFEWERLRAEFGHDGWDRVVRSSVYGNSLFEPARSLCIAAGVRTDFYRGETGAKVTGALSVGYTGIELLRPYVSLSRGHYIYQSPGADMTVDGRSWAVEGGVVMTPHETLKLRASGIVRDSKTGQPSPQAGIDMDGETSLATLGGAPSRNTFEGSVLYTPRNTLFMGFACTRTSFDESWNNVFPSRTILSLSTGLEKKLKGDNLIFEGSAVYKRLYEGESNILDVRAGVRIVDLVIFYHGVNLLDSRFEPLQGFGPQGMYAKWGFYWNFLD